MAREIAVGVIINMTMGIIYIWGVFLLPLEKFLAVPRSQLSIIPSIALVCFTVGMVIHDHVIHRLGYLRASLVAFGLAGAGHLVFAAWWSYWALMVGYGVLFGLGAGIGYGLALTLASIVPDVKRALAIGLVMAAFAFGGVVLPFCLSSIVDSSAPTFGFALIGVAILIVGVFAAWLLTRIDPPAVGAHAGQDNGESQRVKLLDVQFIILALIFFAMCFVGLMTVSQVTGILSSNALSPHVVKLGPSFFTLGYLIGSVFGGKLVEVLSGWRALVLANLVAGGGLLLLGLPSAQAAMLGAVSVGMTFGSSASLMPTLIGESYGARRIGAVYGKLMVSYGIAGLLAPWLGGAIYVAYGSYGPAIAISVVMCVVAVGLGLALGKKRADALAT